MARSTRGSVVVTATLRWLRHSATHHLSGAGRRFACSSLNPATRARASVLIFSMACRYSCSSLFIGPHALLTVPVPAATLREDVPRRSEEHTSELQSPCNL